MGIWFFVLITMFQAWILAPDIGQYPVKSRIMSNKSCFTMDNVVRRQVKNFLWVADTAQNMKFSINEVNMTKRRREFHNENIRIRSMTLFWRVILVNFRPIWHVVFVFFIVIFLKKMPPGINQLKKTYVSRLISPKLGLVNMEQLKYPLTLSWQRLLSYRNQSIDFRSTSMDWFLYDGVIRHERVGNIINLLQLL